MYNCNFYCELALVLSQAPLKRRRAEVHNDTKNATKGAGMTDVRMIQFSAAYG